MLSVGRVKPLFTISKSLKCMSLLSDRIQPHDDRITFCTGEVLHRLQCLAAFGDWINSIVDFGMSLHRMDLDISSLSCMAALTLVTREYSVHRSSSSHSPSFIIAHHNNNSLHYRSFIAFQVSKVSHDIAIMIPPQYNVSHK